MRFSIPAAILALTVSVMAEDTALEPARTLLSHRGDIGETISYVSKLGLMATTGSSKDDGTVMVWDAPAGKAVFAAKAPGRPEQVLLTEDGGQLIVSPGTEGSNAPSGGVTLSRWDIRTGDELEPLKLPSTEAPSRLASSANGKFVAALGGNYLAIWRLSDSKLVFSKKTEKKYSSVAFAPDGFSLLAGGEGGIDQLGLPKGELKTTYTAAKMVAATDIALAPDGEHFAATYVVSPGYHRVGYWQIGKPEIVKEGGAITGSYVSRQLREPVFSQDGKRLQATGYFPAQGSWGLSFSIPELDQQGERFAHRPGFALRTVFGLDPGELLTVGKTDVRRHKIATGELAGGYSLAVQKDNPAALIPLAGDRFLSWGKFDLADWDVARGSMVCGYRKISNARSPIETMLYSPVPTADGSRVLFIEHRDLVVLDLESWEILKRIPLGDDFKGKRLQATPDGSRAVCWGLVGGSLHLVDVNSGSVEKEDLPLNEGERISAIDRELRLAAVVPRPGGYPRLRDLASGELVREFTAAEEALTSRGVLGEGRFSPDGKTLAVWGGGQGVGLSVWDAESGGFRGGAAALGGLYGADFREDGSVVSYDVKRRKLIAIDPKSGMVTEISTGDEGGYAASRFVVTRASGHVVTANAKTGLVVWETK